MNRKLLIAFSIALYGLVALLTLGMVYLLKLTPNSN